MLKNKRKAHLNGEIGLHQLTVEFWLGSCEVLGEREEGGWDHVIPRQDASLKETLCEVFKKFKEKCGWRDKKCFTLDYMYLLINFWTLYIFFPVDILCVIKFNLWSYSKRFMAIIIKIKQSQQCYNGSCVRMLSVSQNTIALHCSDYFLYVNIWDP